MRSETVKHIVKYYGGIPEAIKLLKRERDALEDEYNGLGGLAMDGMPHSSAPGNPTERGTNENTNGMIRRRFPKGTNFAAVTNAQIVQAENWINNYPRKILGYKSSEIVFRECLRELGIAA